MSLRYQGYLVCKVSGNTVGAPHGLQVGALGVREFKFLGQYVQEFRLVGWACSHLQEVVCHVFDDEHSLLGRGGLACLQCVKNILHVVFCCQCIDAQDCQELQKFLSMKSSAGLGHVNQRGGLACLPSHLRLIGFLAPPCLQFSSGKGFLAIGLSALTRFHPLWLPFGGTT